MASTDGSCWIWWRKTGTSWITNTTGTTSDLNNNLTNFIHYYAGIGDGKYLIKSDDWCFSTFEIVPSDLVGGFGQNQTVIMSRPIGIVVPLWHIFASPIDLCKTCWTIALNIIFVLFHETTVSSTWDDSVSSTWDDSVSSHWDATVSPYWDTTVFPPWKRVCDVPADDCLATLIIW